MKTGLSEQLMKCLHLLLNLVSRKKNATGVQAVYLLFSLRSPTPRNCALHTQSGVSLFNYIFLGIFL